jgi:hypothetical protein
MKTEMTSQFRELLYTSQVLDANVCFLNQYE